MPESEKNITAPDVGMGVRPELSVSVDTIPASLAAYPQWVLWRYKSRGEGRKPEKQPIDAKTFRAAGVGWPSTWGAFVDVAKVYLESQNKTRPGSAIHGIGFVLTERDPVVAIDLDTCIGENGLTAIAEETIYALDSYTEVSPSGRGIRILVKAEGFQDNYKTPLWEVYSHQRYVTVTGRQVLGTPCELTDVHPDLITELLAHSHNKASDAPAPPTEQRRLSESVPVDTAQLEALWQHIFATDKWGQQHYERFMGNTAYDGGDHSLSVIRLLNTLAHYTQCNPTLMRAMMLTSSLANDKWFTKRPAGDWLDHVIVDAITYMQGKPKRTIAG
jgi:putative DNA primase/helicase